MSENFVRHIIAFLTTFAFVVVYFVGYFAGARGWVILIIPVLVIYAIIYSLVDA